MTTFAVTPDIGAMPLGSTSIVRPGIVRVPLGFLEVATVSKTSCVAPMPACVVWSLTVAMDLTARPERLLCTPTVAPIVVVVVVEVVVAVGVAVATAQKEPSVNPRAVITLSFLSSTWVIIVVAIEEGTNSDT